MKSIVKKVWDTISSPYVPSYNNDNVDFWEKWQSKSETLKFLEVSTMEHDGPLEATIAHQIKTSFTRHARRFDSAKEVFDHVCSCWQVWVVGRHKDDVELLVPHKAVFYTKDDKLPERENEHFCDILVEGGICLRPVFHSKMSALDELRSM